ncbi:hypothetical protein VN1277_01570 [Helicobacter pylori]|uniref:hypothetical protein n=1 Tax=Helicobacter pylori TaxID=210 RepID=UPI000EAEA697|nr:hypothetical protein [Helicobacter pylori]TPH52474.1 hypothetical protein FIM71_02845 [Helicobacter pylori]GHR85373.1 hypothetical protein VN1277_01570 [Helicobacter pylori]
MAYLKCKSCGHKEETSLKFFVRVIGAALPAGGVATWTTYLLAGTRFALPICAAIITGGVTILAFQDEIIESGWPIKAISVRNAVNLLL